MYSISSYKTHQCCLFSGPFFQRSQYVHNCLGIIRMQVSFKGGSYMRIYRSWLSKIQIPGISKKSKYRSSRKSFFCRNLIRNTQSSIWNTLTLHENWLTSVISNLALKNAFFTAMKTKFLACTLNIIRTQRGSKLSCQLWSFKLWIKKNRFLSHRKVKRTTFNKQSTGASIAS